MLLCTKPILQQPFWRLAYFDLGILRSPSCGTCKCNGISHATSGLIQGLKSQILVQVKNHCGRQTSKQKSHQISHSDPLHRILIDCSYRILFRYHPQMVNSYLASEPQVFSLHQCFWYFIQATELYLLGRWARIKFCHFFGEVNSKVS